MPQASSCVISILRQFFEQCETRGQFLGLEEIFGIEGQMPRLDQLLNTLFITAFQVKQHIYLVIDAPDEAMEQDLALIMESFRRMVTECNRLSLFFTTRHHFVAGDYFEHPTLRRVCISEQKENQDIKIYINLRLQNDKRMAKWPPETKEEVLQKLNEDAAGM